MKITKISVIRLKFSWFSVFCISEWQGWHAVGMEVQVVASAKELQEMIDGHWSALKLLTTLKFIAIVSFENMIKLGNMIQLGKETKKYIL